LKISTSQLKRLVSDKVRISDILYKHNPEGHYEPGQTCFCPFHDNENTPAASIYDNDGVETLYCFSEQKLYTSADAIEILLKKDIYEVGRRLWERMNEVDKKDWLSNQVGGDYSDMFEFDKPTTDYSNLALERAKILFKRRRITLKQLLKEYIKVGGTSEKKDEIP
jgi:hypothetical protein